jgi:NADP-dependent 3-hydroxy acid dehydrogenase YdfG
VVFLEQALDKWGTIDILVNNAGINPTSLDAFFVFVSN